MRAGSSKAAVEMGGGCLGSVTSPGITGYLPTQYINGFNSVVLVALRSSRTAELPMDNFTITIKPPSTLCCKA